eukprot:2364372-Prymnesium_polylepis.1
MQAGPQGLSKSWGGSALTTLQDPGPSSTRRTCYREGFTRRHPTYDANLLGPQVLLGCAYNGLQIGVPYAAGGGGRAR